MNRLIVGKIVAANFLKGKHTALTIHDGEGKPHKLYITEAFQVALPFKLCMHDQFIFTYDGLAQITEVEQV